jgi:hypothetical protein
MSGRLPWAAAGASSPGPTNKPGTAMAKATVRLHECVVCGGTHVLSKGPPGKHQFEPIRDMERFIAEHQDCKALSGAGPAFRIIERPED